MWEHFDRSLVGHAHAKLELAGVLHAYLTHPEVRPPAILLRGERGVGKTLLGSATCASAPLASRTIRTHDEMLLLAVAPPQEQTIVFVDDIDAVEGLSPDEIATWLAEITGAGALVIASAAFDISENVVAAFDDTIELAALSEREIEEVIVHPAGRFEQASRVGAKMGLRLVLHPEAKRLLANAASRSGDGCHLLDRFFSRLATTLLRFPKGDCIIDRDVVAPLLADVTRKGSDTRRGREDTGT
jgi:hypothetical protein